MLLKTWTYFYTKKYMLYIYYREGVLYMFFLIIKLLTIHSGRNELNSCSSAEFVEKCM